MSYIFVDHLFILCMLSFFCFVSCMLACLTIAIVYLLLFRMFLVSLCWCVNISICAFI